MSVILRLMTLKCMLRYFAEYPDAGQTSADKDSESPDKNETWTGHGQCCPPTSDARKLERLRNICEFTKKIPAYICKNISSRF